MSIFGELWHKISGSDEEEGAPANQPGDQPVGEPIEMPQQPQQPMPPSEGEDKEAPVINPQPQSQPEEEEKPPETTGMNM